MMVDLKVIAYFKISFSTRNWDRAFFMGGPQWAVGRHWPENNCESAFTSAERLAVLLSIGSHFPLFQLESDGLAA
ncbi:hypothetical protein [Aeromonas veronii]|uniref:hypothetical protein n=1 Tax=Aeromonas veronii TaxID=654 RepID=UPI0038D30995